MIKYLPPVLALHVFIVGVALLVFINDTFAEGVIGFNGTVIEHPTTREGGGPLDLSEIAAYRVFKDLGTEFEALTPDIIYDSESGTATGAVYMKSDVAKGIVDLCVMTIDTFNQMSTICSDTIQVPFDTPPPSSPGVFTFEHTFSINITTTGN